MIPKHENAASLPVPDDREGIHYTVKEHPVKGMTSEGGIGLPGHKRADPRAVSAQVASQRAAIEAQHQASQVAQRQADAGRAQPQHPTLKVNVSKPARKGR